MSNFFAKLTGKIFTAVFGGKPKTITVANDREREELRDLATKASQGDKEALEAVRERVTPQTSNSMSDTLSAAKKEVEEISQKHETAVKTIERVNSQLDYLRNHPLFTVEGEQVFLTGYKAEMPRILADKFIEHLQKGESIDHLVEFWTLTLLLKNSEARKGLYSFITKQKLMVLPSGYFIGFRRIKKVSDAKVLNTTLHINELQAADFKAKVRKAHQSIKNYDVRREEDGTLFIQVSTVKKKKGEFVDTLANQIAALEIGVDVEAQEAVYTDAHTKKMRIKIGQPVRIPRSQCNEDGRVECSFGLHIGSQTYVAQGSSLGDTIVVCILNPMHVISVPYRDAHKMRMCEYFPAFEISEEELRNFDPTKIDWTPHVRAYRTIEDARAKKALEVIETLTEEERKNFVPEVVDEKQIEALGSRLNKATTHYDALKKKLSILLEDDISNSLDFNELEEILKRRVQKV